MTSPGVFVMLQTFLQEATTSQSVHSESSADSSQESRQGIVTVLTLPVTHHWKPPPPLCPGINQSLPRAVGCSPSVCQAADDATAGPAIPISTLCLLLLPLAQAYRREPSLECLLMPYPSQFWREAVFFPILKDVRFSGICSASTS